MKSRNYSDLTYKDLEKENPYNITPYQISLGIIPKCNSKCSYCVNWNDYSSIIPNIDQLIDIISAAKNLGVKQVLISGGEPLMHPLWMNIVQKIKEMDLDVLIITNGLLLNDTALTFLNEIKVKKLGISLDTISSSIYKIIRGVPINNLVSTITTINKYPNISNVLSICCTVHKMNIDSLDELLDFCMLNNLSIQFQPLQLDNNSPNNAKEYWPEDEQLLQIKNFFEKVSNIQHQRKIISNSPDYINKIYDYLHDRHFIPESCYAPFAQITIDQALKLRPCWAMKPVGDVSSGEDLIKLWNSNGMNEVRQKTQKGLCPGCFYSCHLSKKYNKL